MRKAFTLIELLIVVAIIGILSTALLPNLSNSQAKARDVARIAAIKDAITAAESYLIDNSEYPAAYDCSNTIFGDLYTRLPFAQVATVANDYASCLHPVYIPLTDGYAVSVPLELAGQANSCFGQVSVLDYGSDYESANITLSDSPDCSSFSDPTPAYTVVR